MSETKRQILELIHQGENLTTEFKSDLKCLLDRELVAAVVALANTEGGDLLLGVEDNGGITGPHANYIPWPAYLRVMPPVAGSGI